MRMKERKNMFAVLFVIGFMFVFGIYGNDSVNAAAKFQVINSKGTVAKYSFSRSQNNQDIVIENTNTGKIVNKISPRYGGMLGYTYVTDGSIVYYSEADWNEMRSYLFKYSINTGKTELLKKVSDIIETNYYYNGVLYVLRGEIDQDFCSYDIKTGKIKKIASCSAGVKKQYGKYLCIEATSGDYYPVSLYIYDTKSGKTKELKGTISVTYSKNRIYYAVVDVKSFNANSDNNVNIWCYDVKTSKKTQLVKNLNAYIVGKCTDSYVYYSTHDSGNMGSYPCYKYDIAIGKSKKVSELKH